MNKHDTLDKKVKMAQHVMQQDRFRNVMAFLVHKGLLISNVDYGKFPILDIKDALWASSYEPRILEVLPAAILHFPKSIVESQCIPLELKIIIDQISAKRKTEKKYYCGIEIKKMEQIANQRLADNRTVPQKQKRITRSFRLKPTTIDKLKKLSKNQQTTMTECLEALIDVH